MLKRLRILLTVGIIVAITATIVVSSLYITYSPPSKSNSFPFEASNSSNISLNQTHVQQAVNSTLTNLTQENFTEYIGNHIDVGLSTANSAVVFSSKDVASSIRFTAKYSGDASALVVKVLTSENHKFLVGLQDDNGKGVPSGSWLSSGIGWAKGDRFMETSLEKPVPIVEGHMYHIVVMLNDSLSQKDASVMTYAAKSSFQPYNPENIDMVWSDPIIDVLSFDGKSWNDESKWPTFVIRYTDGREEGQPYTLYAPWVIHNSVYVGEVFVPSKDYKVRNIGFVVDAKGKAQDSLYFEILDSKNEIVSHGVLGTPGQIGIGVKKWVDAPLDVSVMLKKGDLYRLVLYSPKTGADQAYEMYGHEFTYNDKIGYGGLQDELTISDNSGTTWQPWDDADAIFRLLVE
jgi:hypothetical protein